MPFDIRIGLYTNITNRKVEEMKPINPADYLAIGLSDKITGLVSCQTKIVG